MGSCSVLPQGKYVTVVFMLKHSTFSFYKKIGLVQGSLQLEMAFEGESDLYGEIHGHSIGVEKLNVCFPSASHLRSRDAAV